MVDRSPRHIELISVAPDHVVVTFRTPPGELVRIQVTPIRGDAPAAAAESAGRPAANDPRHDYHWARVDGLAPDTEYRVAVEGATRLWNATRAKVRTPRRPPGARIARIAMTNDVHFGEEEAGRVEQLREYKMARKLPLVRSLVSAHKMPPGMAPHTRVMGEGAVRDIQEWGPDLVVVKGDLTSTGREEQLDEFAQAYAPFSDRIVAFRGNHDARLPDHLLPPRFFATELDGITVAVIDTVVPGSSKGAVSKEQIEWLREYARVATQPILVVGHHNLYMNRSGHGPGKTFFYGVNPADSAALLEVFAEHEMIAGYFAGHTHKNLHNEGPRGIPIVETASAKEFPGTWAAYEVFEGGYLQTLYQISSPEALAWSTSTKAMFFGLAPVFNRGRVTDRSISHDFARPTIAARDAQPSSALFDPH